MTGACVSGPALALGLFDIVVMTDDAFAYVTGPDSVAEFTGVPSTASELGGAAVHARRSGVASLVVADEVAARDALPTCLAFLPDHHLVDPPRYASTTTRDRACTVAAAPSRSGRPRRTTCAP